MRRAPADFRVDEVLGFEPSGNGEHVFLQIRKTSANTAWVAGQLARVAGIRQRDVSYAGRKDRHAVTSQWFSCWLPRSDPDFAHLLDAEGVEILRVSRHANKLRRGEHAANRFRLRVSGSAIDGVAPEALSARLGALQDGFPNYFTEQRFGFGADNLTRALRFFAQPNRRKARKHRDRDLFYSAARAFLFNRLLDADVQTGQWREGAATLVGDARLSPAEHRVLAPYESLTSGLAADRSQPGSRPRCVRPAHFTTEVADNVLTLSFELPPGAYATALLREIGTVVDLSACDGRDALSGGEAP